MKSEPPFQRTSETQIVMDERSIEPDLPAMLQKNKLSASREVEFVFI
jgi:hypothetical protein